MPGTVKANLNYYPKTGGQQIHLGSLDMFRRTFDTREVEVNDIRGRESSFDLDIHGFMLHLHSSEHLPLTDPSTVTGAMYSETAALLQKITGATRVHIFSHLIRNAPFETIEKMAAASGPDSQRTGSVAPARAVHVDQSVTGAYDILHDNISKEEVERLQKTRWAIFNVWRPLAPIQRDPLAVCDARSAQDEELVDIPMNLPAKNIGSDKYNALSKGQSFGTFRVKHSSAHQWYYASNMTPEEVLLIKIFDSDVSGQRARRTPHSAFADPTARQTPLPRESLEIRCLAFFENEPAK